MKTKIEIPTRKKFSEILKCTFPPKITATKIAGNPHQKLAICVKSKVFCQKYCAPRIASASKKIAAMLARNCDLFLKISFVPKNKNGPPVPKIPCAKPEKKRKIRLKNFGNFKFFKNKFCAENKIKNAAKNFAIIGDDKFFKK